MNDELRLYCIALRHLSPIQKGIQCQHATVEHSVLDNNELFNKWATRDRTTILLEAHSANSGTESMYGLNKELGQMETIESSLKEFGIKYATFREPDINYALTAICFVVTNTVYDKETFLDFAPWMKKRYPSFTIKEDYKSIDSTAFPDEYDVWSRSMKDDYRTGKQNTFLRDLLQQFKLAT